MAAISAASGKGKKGIRRLAVGGRRGPARVAADIAAEYIKRMGPVDGRRGQFLCSRLVGPGRATRRGWDMGGRNWWRLGDLLALVGVLIAGLWVFGAAARSASFHGDEAITS